MFPWGSGWPREGREGKGDKALGGMERCQQPLVYLFCYDIAPQVLLSSRSKLRQQPTLPGACLLSLAASSLQRPAAGCSQLPLAFLRSPPRPPVLPLTQHPLIGGGRGAHRQDAGCVHPAVPEPPSHLGYALPLSWMGCKQTPILTKPESESCSLLSLSPWHVFREGRKFGIPLKPGAIPSSPCHAPQQAARSISSFLAAPESTAQLVSLQLTRRTA